MVNSVVIMGVAGCGKSSLGAALAQAEGLRLVEGDDFHSPESRAKMSQGVALTDADRAQWLARLGQILAETPAGLVLTCSALKRRYRDGLRAQAPGLRFVFLDTPIAVARARVATRPGHFFAAGLVDSQFVALESPVGERGVLAVDATQGIDALTGRVRAWLHEGEKH